MKKAKGEFSLPSFLVDIARGMETAFQQQLVEHPTLLGSDREEVVRRFLEAHLPEKFGVTTGFVFDTLGNISRQTDVIIFDKANCPMFRSSGGTRFLPCEAVLAVGEIKSSLTSKRDYLDALESIRSVKALHRSDSLATTFEEEILDNQSNHLDQIFGFLWVTGKILKESSGRRWLMSIQDDDIRHLWINLIFGYGSYILTYSCQYGWCPNPMDAEGLSVLEDVSADLLLMTFYLLLGRALAVTRVAHFPYAAYLPGLAIPFSAHHPLRSDEQSSEAET